MQFEVACGHKIARDNIWKAIPQRQKSIFGSKVHTQAPLRTPKQTTTYAWDTDVEKRASWGIDHV